MADGKVVTLGVGGVVSCLDAASGKLLWRKDPMHGTVPMFFTAMSPIIVDGMCVAQLGGRGKGAMIAFDLATGNEKWKWEGDGPAYGSPVLMTVDGTKQIVAQTEKSIVGVAAADGKLLWKIATPDRGHGLQLRDPDRRWANSDLHRARRGHQGREGRETGRQIRHQRTLEEREAGHRLQYAGAEGRAAFRHAGTAARSSACGLRRARRRGPSPGTAARATGRSSMPARSWSPCRSAAN